MRRHEQREQLFKLVFMTVFNHPEELPEQIAMYFEESPDAVEDGEVIGYIAGYAMDDVTIEFPFFHEELELLLTTLKSGISYYTSHLVVHPNARGKGIGKQLVARYMEAVKQKADVVVVVGWVKSDTNKWDAEKQFMSHGFTHKLYIKRYFEPYNVYCPSCQGTCYCDANIVWKILS